MMRDERLKCPQCGARLLRVPCDELASALRQSVQRELRWTEHRPICSGTGCQTLAQSMLDEYVRSRNRAGLPAIRASEV